jgi:hypothetical protein
LLSTLYSCQILIKLEFSVQIFEIWSNIKFHENPSSRSRVVVPCERKDRQTDGRTDPHDETHSRFPQLRTRLNMRIIKLKNERPWTPSPPSATGSNSQTRIRCDNACPLSESSAMERELRVCECFVSHREATCN